MTSETEDTERDCVTDFAIQAGFIVSPYYGRGPTRLPPISNRETLQDFWSLCVQQGLAEGKAERESLEAQIDGMAEDYQAEAARAVKAEERVEELEAAIGKILGHLGVERIHPAPNWTPEQIRMFNSLTAREVTGLCAIEVSDEAIDDRSLAAAEWAMAQNDDTHRLVAALLKLKDEHEVELSRLKARLARVEGVPHCEGKDPSYMPPKKSEAVKRTDVVSQLRAACERLREIGPSAGECLLGEDADAGEMLAHINRVTRASTWLEPMMALAADSLASLEERVARLEAASGEPFDAKAWCKLQEAQLKPHPLKPIPPADAASEFQKAMEADPPTLVTGTEDVLREKGYHPYFCGTCRATFLCSPGDPAGCPYGHAIPPADNWTRSPAKKDDDDAV